MYYDHDGLIGSVNRLLASNKTLIVERDNWKKKAEYLAVPRISQVSANNARLSLRTIAIPNATPEIPLLVNVYYQNTGALPADEIAHVWRSGRIPEQPKDENEIELKVRELQDQMLKYPRWQHDMNAKKGQELSSGNERFFSIPDDPNGEEAHLLSAYVASPATSMLYILSTFKYHDSSLPPSAVLVTEDCTWFLGKTGQRPMLRTLVAELERLSRLNELNPNEILRNLW